jgi:hypothetical protein
MEPGKSDTLKRFERDLAEALKGVGRVLGRYGVSNWKTTLIVRDSASDKPGRWV